MTTLTAADAKSYFGALLMSDVTTPSPTQSPMNGPQTIPPEIVPPARPHSSGPKRLSDPVDSSIPPSAPCKNLETAGNRSSRTPSSHVIFPRASTNNFSRVRLSKNLSSEEDMPAISVGEREEAPRSSRGGRLGQRVEFFSPATFQQVLLDRKQIKVSKASSVSRSLPLAP